MAELDASRKSNSNAVEEEEPETTPKIFYVSRTHSQLSQFVAELRKTKFGKQIKIRQLDENGSSVEGKQKDLDWEPVRTVSLGSRKQMCINEAVQKIGKRAGTEAMNERCRELAKGGELQDSTEREAHLSPRLTAHLQSTNSLASTGKGEKRCEFLASQNDLEGQTQLLDFRDQTFVSY